MTEPEILSEITIRVVRNHDGQDTLDITCSGGTPARYIKLLEQTKQSIMKSVGRS